VADATGLTHSGSTWTGGDALTLCGVDYTLKVTRDAGGPNATLTAPDLVTVYPMVRESCGRNSAVFTVGDPAVCTGDEACGGPAANLTRIRVRWAHCEYGGAGWYCARQCGGFGDGEAVLLGDEDAGDPEIEILSGPYDTEEEAGCAPAAAGDSCVTAGEVAIGAYVSGALAPGVTTGGTYVPTEAYYCVPVTDGVTYRMRWVLNGDNPGVPSTCLTVNAVPGGCGADSVGTNLLYVCGSSSGGYASCLTYTAGGGVDHLCVRFFNLSEEYSGSFVFMVDAGAGGC